MCAEGGTFLLYCYSNLAENGLSSGEDRFEAFARTGPGTRRTLVVEPAPRNGSLAEMTYGKRNPAVH
jgi:hypothetical protein